MRSYALLCVNCAQSPALPLQYLYVQEQWSKMPEHVSLPDHSPPISGKLEPHYRSWSIAISGSHLYAAKIAIQRPPDQRRTRDEAFIHSIYTKQSAIIYLHVQYRVPSKQDQKRGSPLLDNNGYPFYRIYLPIRYCLFKMSLCNVHLI